MQDDVVSHVSGLTHVSFSAGGTRGFAFCGVMDALEDTLPDYETWHSALCGIAGTSAGAIMALTFALNIDRSTRRTLLSTFNIEDVVPCPNIALFFKHHGFEDGKGLREFIGRLLSAGGLCPRSRMRDLKRLLRKRVTFTCSDLHTSLPKHVSADSHPDMLVCDAVYASCSVPILFVPLREGEELLCDGCLCEHLPRVSCDAETLFIHMQCPTLPLPKSPTMMEYLSAIIRCAGRLQDRHCQLLANEFPKNVIQLQDGGKCISPMELDIDQCKIQQHYLSGYACAMDHLYGHKLSVSAGGIALHLMNIVSEFDVPTYESASEGDPCT